MSVARLRGRLLLLGFALIGATSIARAEPVAVRGHTAFEVRAALGEASPAERARAGSAILARVIEDPAPAPVTLATPADHPDERILRVGERDLLRLGPPDAAASTLSPTVYYDSVRADVEAFIARERRRAHLQEGVLAVSMVVFLGLIALLLVRAVGRRGDEARAWVERRAASLEGLHIKQLQVLSREALESLALIGLGVSTLLLRVGIVWAYAVYALSQFSATQPWVGQLTSLVVSPFGVLAGRLGHALPVAILLVVAFYVVRGSGRIVGRVLDHVARGELKTTWLPPDMAAAARPIAHIVLVLTALLALAPIVSGASDGTLGRLGLMGLGALALGAVPLAAAATVGAAALFGRRFVLGQWIEIGPHLGEVTEVTFLDVCLVPLDGGRVRVPHLATLWQPVHHLQGPPSIEVVLTVDAKASPPDVIALLHRVAAPLGKSTVQLESLAASGATYRIAVVGAHPDARSALLVQVAGALAQAGLALG